MNKQLYGIDVNIMLLLIQDQVSYAVQLVMHM